MPRTTVLAFTQRLVTAIAFAAISGTAQAYSTFPDGSGGVLKWGASNTPGTASGTVTWGFIPAGTAGSAYCGTACPGNSVTSIQIENSPGTGYTLTPLTSLAATITATINQWAAVSDITFLGPLLDGGLPVNDPNAGAPHIRIGVFGFSGGGGAVGFAPPPNGGTGAGEILFDANSFYAFQPGNDGDPFPAASTAPNDFVSLLLHEMGHAIGLAHPAFDGSCPVMDVAQPCLGKINRILDADDIAGAQYLYGVAVPVPAGLWLLLSGLLGVGVYARSSRLPLP